MLYLRASERLAWLTPERFCAMSQEEQMTVLGFAHVREAEERRSLELTISAATGGRVR